MFSFQRSGELSFQTMDFVAEKDQNNVENQIFWTDNADASATMNTNIVDFGHNNNRGRSQGRGRSRGQGRDRGRKSTAGISTNCNDDNSDEQKRKAIHREIERQRRLKMSNLYASLRSTLPPGYTQGKRSATDHVAEAANYIKDLEKNVKDLADKRDELKESSEWTPCSNYQLGGSSNNSRPRQGSVVIEPRLGTLNIDIDIGCEDESFGLSSPLQVAFEEGLGVLSCTSTRVDDRLIHNIVCEVTDITCIDLSRLQWRLNDLVR